MFTLTCLGIIAAATAGGIGVLCWGVSRQDKKKEDQSSDSPYERPLSLEREDMTTYP